MEQDLSGSSELGDTKMGVASFLVGIDLGTTNSSLSFISADPGANSSPTLLDHCPAQITQPFEWADRPLLPSFLYFSTGNDLPEGCLQLPWSPKESSPTRIVVGEFARKQGDSVPGQLVHSAKSWLSCPGADRKERILPWPGSENTPKISPVEASAAYLNHWQNLGRIPKEPGIPLAVKRLSSPFRPPLMMWHAGSPWTPPSKLEFPTPYCWKNPKPLSIAGLQNRKGPRNFGRV